MNASYLNKEKLHLNELSCIIDNLISGRISFYIAQQELTSMLSRVDLIPLAPLLDPIKKDKLLEVLREIM